ncbi:MAG: antibiotic biosynthesis monooxygenase [Chloroflexi bacterium]|nr:antibiotic biosynthesis monooxygenase [Chloroflexota bacterium]
MYGYFGTMRTHPGKRDEVIDILLRAAEDLGSHGCHAYIVGAGDSPDLICITELCDSRASHDLSLLAPVTRRAISEAMPMLTGEFTGHEMTVRGGLGIPE